jgi:SH3-like domain-containing protein
VKAASINVRKEPSAKAEVICVLHHKKSVRILKKVDATWVEIEAFCDDNRRVTGYVHRSLLN